MSGVTVDVLGPLRVAVRGRPVRLSAGRLRTLLALLALSAGKPVSLDRLATEIWQDRLPRSPRRSLQTYAGRLRATLGRGAIGAHSAGLVLHVRPEQVDALRFERAVADASRAADRTGERALLGDALGMWRGAPFEDIRCGWLEEGEAPRLVELRLAALERRIDLDIASGRQGQLVAELGEWTALHPLRESLWTRLLLVLDRCGRQAEALQRYGRAREQIGGDLGVDPGPTLQRIHADLLAGRPVTAHVSGVDGGPVVVASRRTSSDAGSATGGCSARGPLTSSPHDAECATRPPGTVVPGPWGDRTLTQHHDTTYLFRQLLDLAVEVAARNAQFDVRNGLGRIHRVNGRADEPLSRLHRALDIAADLHQDQARHHWRQALNILGALGAGRADAAMTQPLPAAFVSNPSMSDPPNGGRTASRRPAGAVTEGATIDPLREGNRHDSRVGRE